MADAGHLATPAVLAFWPRGCMAIDLTDKCVFPSGEHAKALLNGEPGGLAGSVEWSLRRAALIGIGMSLAGERDRVVKKAIIGSLGVEAMVIACVIGFGEAEVPSAKAALDGNPLQILMTYLIRSSVVAGSLYLAGERDNLWRNSLAGCAAIEAVVLYWASQCRKQREQPTFIPG